jgi:hypothetical protein
VQGGRLVKAEQSKANAAQGYLAHKKTPTPYDHHRALGIALLKGPMEGCFLVSEVPLYTDKRARLTNGAWGAQDAWALTASHALPGPP